MNLSEIKVPTAPQFGRIYKDAPEQNVNFISFRQLNKRARVRLSQEPFALQPGVRSHLLAVANTKGWFAAAARDSSNNFALVFSSLLHLRESFAGAGQDGEIPFTPQRTLPLKAATPTILAFASKDSRLIVGVSQGPIFIYDTAILFDSGSNVIQPLHTIQSSYPSSPLQITANPAEIPQLIAILRSSETFPKVEVFDLEKMEVISGWKSGSYETSPTSLSWSPRGKQLAVAVRTGDVLTFNPYDTSAVQSHVPAPETSSAQRQNIISTAWLSNSTFHAVYAASSAPYAEQTHYVLSRSSSPPEYTATKLDPPTGSGDSVYSVILRAWGALRFMLLVGDALSSEIGVIGCSDTSGWHKLSLEEDSSTPILPLDRNTEDTFLVGLEVDLTSLQGEGDLPPAPVMLAFVSDGTVQAWHVINSSCESYSGMIPPSSVTSTTQSTSTPVTEDGVNTAVSQSSQSSLTFGQSQPQAVFGQTPQSVSAFSATSQTAPSFGQPSVLGQTPQVTPAFGQPSPFGQNANSTFGQSSFSQPSAFEQPSFGQSPLSAQMTSGSTFGKASGFGQTSPAPVSPFAPSSYSPAVFGNASTAPSTGFGAFASNAPAKFGHPTFGFSAPSASSSASVDEMAMDARSSSIDSGLSSLIAPPIVSTPSSSMDVAPSSAIEPASSSGIGGLSLGDNSAISTPRLTSSVFGAFGQPSAASPAPLATGSKPSTGFGAFANVVQSQDQPATTQPTATQPMALPDSGFGITGFASRPSAFPSTASKTAFGTASVFGTSNAPPPSKSFASSSSSTGSAFSAFAAQGPTAFGPSVEKAKDTKPIWATSGGNAFANDVRLPSVPREGSAFGSAEREPSSLQAARRSPGDASPIGSPPSSPDTSPRPLPTKASVPSLAFQSSMPAPSTGAFSNLQTSTTGFLKPASGFGAFGAGSRAPSAPPFMKPPDVKPAPLSVFSSSTPSSTTPGSTAARIPTFGATSALGAPKSAFASATPAPSPVMSMASGGFGAFAGSSSGFSAFAGPQKAFGELLKQGGNDSKGQDKSPPSISIFSRPESNQESERKPTSITDSAGKPPPMETIAREESASVGSVSKDTRDSDGASVEKADRAQGSENGKETGGLIPNHVDEDAAPRPETTESVRQAVEPTIYDTAETDERVGKGIDLTPKTSTPIRDESSFGSISLSSEGSSFFQFPDDDGESDNANNPNLDGETYEKEGTEDGFLSDTYSDRSEEQSEEAILDEEESTSEELENDPVPSIPKAVSRSASTTPQPQTPNFIINASQPRSKEPDPRSPSAEDSTTPPGSPFRLPSSTTPTVSASTTLAPLPPTPMGLVKPNTRPARCSPLVTVLSGDGKGELSDKSLVPSKPPSSLVLKPASPKQPFGAWSVLPVKTEQQDPPEVPAIKKSPRPSTPPLLFSAGPTSTSSPSLPSAKSTLLFASPTPTKPTPDPGSLHPVLHSSLTSAPVASQPKPNLSNSIPFSLSAPSESALITKNSTTYFAPPPNLFASGWPSTPPPFPRSTSTFPSTSPSPLTLSNSSPSTPPAMKHPRDVPPNLISSNAPLPEPTVEQGMQAECAYLFDSLAKELEDLHLLAQQARNKRAELEKSSKPSRTLDLRDRSRWGMGDVPQFALALKRLEKDISTLKDQRLALRKEVGDFERSIFKANTRKEEIMRFQKAQSDAEFTQMLKVRTLGPDHLETQTQLRRNVGAMRDRIQKLEDRLLQDKKRLNQMKTCTPSLKAPSLDTINRVYRNIDIAIEQQSMLMAKLTSRVSKIDLTTALQSGRDKRLPDSKQPVNVTPNVAVTTAAALNAERAAQKLKRSLLAARKEPLLNTTAADAPASPVAFRTPQKPLTFEPRTPDWSPLSANESPSYSIAPRRGGGSKKHDRPVALKKSPAAPASTPSFDWGPLPSMTPMTSLPVDLRKK